MNGDSVKAWICPSCGQWGKDKFGQHRLPLEAWDAETTCDMQPVLIEVGPLWRWAQAQALS